jgi:predicted SAM-dependent methyltransferase
MKDEIKTLIDEKQGILLDIGCGSKRHEGFIGLDRRAGDGVDIVHDLEVFPYPLPDECCLSIIGVHVFEHIKPWLSIDFMNELWRITKRGGQLALSMPYGFSQWYLQDPTHCNPSNEKTFLYFDSRHRELYDIYKPKPWHIEEGFPVFHENSNMEVLMKKVYE